MPTLGNTTPKQQFSRYLLRDSPKVLSGCAILVWLRAIVCLVGACRVLQNFVPGRLSRSSSENLCCTPLHSNGSACTINRRSCHKYTGSQSGSGPCEQRHLCLRHPQRTAVRQVAIFAKGQASVNAVLEAMKQRIDSPQGRQRYSQRIGTVEPVFGSIRHIKRLNRLTLRGQHKVGAQWRLYCLVHNIEKLAGCGLRK